VAQAFVGSNPTPRTISLVNINSRLDIALLDLDG